jgi:endoglucanase
MRVLVTGMAALVVAVPVAFGWDSSGPDSAGNPLAGVPWFVDDEWGLAQREYRNYVAQGDAVDARLMKKLAEQPETKRFGTWDKEPGDAARSYLDRAERSCPGCLSFIYVYRLLHERCGRYDAGGAAEANRYRAWVTDFAAALQGHRVVIFLEPDALGTADCLTRAAARTRWSSLGFASAALVNAGATVYVDAGAVDWLGAREAARRLRLAGVSNPAVRGFFLNGTHFAPTRDNLRYGEQIVKRLGGRKHFVVSTAVNGNGQRWVNKRRNVQDLCNPPGRALGPRPTVKTGSPHADALVWIGNPRRSAGHCHGAPATGAWWPEYALALARRAAY